MFSLLENVTDVLDGRGSGRTVRVRLLAGGVIAGPPRVGRPGAYVRYGGEQTLRILYDRTSGWGITRDRPPACPT